MLTPQEVSNHAFTKAMMGGYNMAMVDEFLDELTEDYTTLFKENAALKAKMKVLVDKVEEYRATEDSMRATLLTAQKMANTIVEDAEKQKLTLLAEAEQAAREKIGAMQGEVYTHQRRLEEGRQELGQFVRAARELCQKQLEFLGILPELPVEPFVAPAAEAEESAVNEIGDNILAAFGANMFDESAGEQVAPPAQREEAAIQDTAAPDQRREAQEPEEDVLLDSTRRLNLKDLKFGRNYNGN